MAKTKQKGASKILLFSVIILTIITMSGVGYLFYTDGEIAFAQESKKEKEPIKIATTEPLEVFTNLKTESINPHYVRAKIALGVEDDEKILEDVKKAEVRIRDVYNDYFRSSSYLQIANSTNEELKKQLKENVEERLNIKVEAVYFAEYVIQ